MQGMSPACGGAVPAPCEPLQARRSPRSHPMACHPCPATPTNTGTCNDRLFHRPSFHGIEAAGARTYKTSSASSLEHLVDHHLVGTRHVVRRHERSRRLEGEDDGGLAGGGQEERRQVSGLPRGRGRARPVRRPLRADFGPSWLRIAGLSAVSAWSCRFSGHFAGRLMRLRAALSASQSGAFGLLVDFRRTRRCQGTASDRFWLPPLTPPRPLSRGRPRGGGSSPRRVRRCGVVDEAADLRDGHGGLLRLVAVAEPAGKQEKRSTEKRPSGKKNVKRTRHIVMSALLSESSGKASDSDAPPPKSSGVPSAAT